MLLLIATSVSIKAQDKHTNIQNNFGTSGYDLVSYFNSKALKGKDNFTLKHEGVSYRFSSKLNLMKFEQAPEKYLPQYGGWCAYAMATKGEKVKVNPKTFELRNGKLFLFYNAYFDNTLENWLEEGPEELVNRADNNWAKIMISSESD